MLHFLISDSYTVYNKGDAAIVTGMLKTIRNIYPDSKISILSLTPNYDNDYYSRFNARTFPRLFSKTFDEKHYIPTAIFYFFKAWLYLLSIWFKPILLSETEKQVLNLYREADLVITCGGGYLGGRSYYSIIAHLFPMYLAKKMGKKVYIYAQSVEPFASSLVKILTKFILNSVDLVTVREIVSLEVLKKIKISTPTYLTADPAFLIESESIKYAQKVLAEHGIKKKPNELLIGITARCWNFPNDNDRDIKIKQYSDALRITLEKIIEHNNVKLIFFPQVIFYPDDDDRIISIQICNSIRHDLRKNVIILKENYFPEQLKAIIGLMDIFVGTRMHSNIFAVSMNVPVVAIAYEQKTYGIMKMIGLEDYTISISNIKAEKLIELIEKAIENREKIIKMIGDKLPLIKREAIRNGELIKHIM